ncbi:MAG: acyl-CoA dehydrogenase family protein [Rhodocyclales bacterium]|nr:acyl-CoA dehydrogenase family protein [Rhodocyclales bacterium]
MIDLRNYGFDEQHQQVYDMAWRYARERHHPLLRRMDDDDWFPADEYRKMGDVGLLGTTVPESLGSSARRCPTGTTCSVRAGVRARTCA